MNSDPLSQLRDIHLPDAISWWPVAPGWWLVAALVAISVYTGARWLTKRTTKNHYRSEALTELQKSFADHREAPQTLAEQVLSILRRCALTIGIDNIANQSASQLIRLLDRQAGKPIFGDSLAARMDEIAYAAYPPPLTENEIDDLQQRATQWIKWHHGGACD